MKTRCGDAVAASSGNDVNLNSFDVLCQWGFCLYNTRCTTPAARGYLRGRPAGRSCARTCARPAHLLFPAQSSVLRRFVAIGRARDADAFACAANDPASPHAQAAVGFLASLASDCFANSFRCEKLTPPHWHRQHRNSVLHSAAL